MKPACWRLAVFPGTGPFQYNNMIGDPLSAGSG